jgi:hypothetical protein
MKALHVPLAAMMSSITRSAFGLSDWTYEPRTQSHNIAGPSGTLAHRILQDHEEDAIVEWAMANCEGNTLEAIRNQVNRGQKILFKDLKRGDIVLLCAYHEVYGQGARQYLYWGKASVGGDERLVFLTLVTCGRKGVKESPYWFLKHVSYQFQTEGRKESRVFVSWTQAIIVKPKHDYIVGTRERLKATVQDLNNLLESMGHSLNCHAELLGHLTTLNHMRVSYPSEKERKGAYFEARDDLKKLTSKDCPDATCSIHLDLLSELPGSYRYFEDDEWFRKYFPINRHPPVLGNNSHKCQPPEDFCKCLTGQVEPFYANIHMIED